MQNASEYYGAAAIIADNGLNYIMNVLANELGNDVACELPTRGIRLHLKKDAQRFMDAHDG
ncbi:MAG: hypothetical protein FJ245_10440 [Nitrospira sp.]|nr:hypothetical protein [Nitrospira sp.]